MGSFVLAACSSSQSGSIPPVNPGQLRLAAAASPVAHSLANGRNTRRSAEVTLRIRVPRREHRPRYVSPATKAMTVDLRGPSPIDDVVGLTPNSPGCTAEPSGGVDCKFAVMMAPGRYAVTVTTFDQAPVRGKIPSGARELSIAHNVPAAIAGGRKNQVRLTLEGVPSEITLALPAASAGTPFSSPQAIGVNVADADGYTIVGAYDSPIALSDSDTSGATLLSTSGSDNPPSLQLLSSSDTAALSYTGLAIAAATITAGVQNSATSGSAQFKPTLQPIVVTTSDTQNPAFAGIDLYAVGAGVPGSTGSFTASEAGLTNAPYDKAIGAALQGACSTIATVAPASGTTFSVSAVADATPGQCTLTLSDGLGQSLPLSLVYSRFAFTGSQQLVTVPAGVTSVTISAYGAAGGGDGAEGGGLGGWVSAVVPVTGGQTLYINTGGIGETIPADAGQTTGAGGFNGGGAGGSGGAGGGGASDVRTGGVSLSNRIAVAGGGGGAAYCDQPANGGAGGGPTGGYGGDDDFPPDDLYGGQGGSQTAGGNPGGDPTGATAGSLGLGGIGSTCAGGGGGGGYYGGGGGGADEGDENSGGGGGGSSYIATQATSVIANSQGVSNAGLVLISW